MSRVKPSAPAIPNAIAESRIANIEGIGVRALVGDIRLTPTKAGYLEATLTGRYAGLVNLLSGGKLNRGGCGGRI